MMKLNVQKFGTFAKKTTTFKESGIDIANNQSDLTITITFYDTQGSAWFGSATLNCTCNGTKKSANVSLSKGGKVTKSFTFENITHNSDGKKSVSWTWSCATGTSNLGTVSDSGTKALTTIARASKVYATNCDIGSFSTITVNKYKDSFTTSLYYKTSSDSDYVAVVGASKISGTSFAFEIPESWYNKIPNAKTMTCSIKAETYNGSSNIGSNTCSFTITANEELCRPMITGSVVDTNDDVYALTNSRTRFVKYKSLPKVTWEASAKNGATLVSQKASGVETTSPYTYTDWKNVMVEIVDSRGYANMYWAYDLDVVDYFEPTIQVLGGRTSPTSDSATISIYGSFFNGYFDVNNTNLNNLTISYKYREIGTTEWTNGGTIPVTKENNSFKNEDYVISDLFNYQKSYEVQVVATDSLSTSLPYTFKVIKGIPVFDWCKDFLRANELFIADKNAVLNDSTKTGTEYDTVLGGTQINGSFFLNGKLINKNIITARPTTYTSSAKQSIMPMNNKIIIGNKLSVENNAIVIGSGVSKVKVSANGQFVNQSTTYNMNVEINIMVNDSNEHVAINYFGTSRYATASISDFVMNVKEGDKIQLRLWNNAAANYEVRYSGTWLTIEVIE